MPKLYLTMLCTCLMAGLSAQEVQTNRSKTYTIGANLFQGTVLEHDQSLSYLSGTNPNGFEVFVNRNTYGGKAWQEWYNYPDIGFSLTYFNMDNEAVLGKMVSLLVYMNAYLFRKKQSELFVRLGTGFGYSSNPFDPETNSTNNVISTKFSGGMQARLGYNISLSDKLKLTTAITLTHFSNGTVKKPNKGINIPTFNAGVSYALYDEKPEYQQHGTPELNKKSFHWNMIVATGAKVRNKTDPKRYPFYSLAIYADKRVSRRSRINFGIDGFMDLSSREDAEDKYGGTGEDIPDYKRIGLGVSHDLLLGNMSLFTEFGVYIYKPLSSDKPIYQKYGLKYFFNDRLFASAILKVHLGKADAMEWGIGVRL